MACLGTSGRQGLFVAVGTRCYRNQKFLCQLFLQNNSNSNKISNRQSVVGDGDGAFTDDGAITISKLLLNGNNTSASALSYGSTSTRYPVQKRHFHLLTNTTVPVAAACSANKDYSIMMVNTKISHVISVYSSYDIMWQRAFQGTLFWKCRSLRTLIAHYWYASSQFKANQVKRSQKLVQMCNLFTQVKSEKAKAECLISIM
uniref:Uncharacterized protein n=1 Tax=Glossina pallidipes TaxID=7398 RepID=A0A1A9ZJJ7_GLOPL